MKDKILQNLKISYAQNREDIILDGFFSDRTRGFYVDIGAYDPDVESVTKLFYIKGWTGINVEPQPDRYKFFVNKRPKDINVNLGISNKQSKLQLRSYANQGWSTFSPQIKSEYEEHTDINTQSYTEIQVEVITLAALFEKYAVKEINFLKVDVEGLEYEVLEGNDWQKYRPEVLCIEANHIQKDWRKLIRSHGYSLVFFDGLNEYYTDNNSDRAKKFDYLKAVVFKEPIAHYALMDVFRMYSDRISSLEEGIATQQEELAAANAASTRLLKELEVARKEFEEIASLKRHIKRAVKRRVQKVDHQLTKKLTRQNNYRPQSIHAANKDKSSVELLRTARINDQANFEEFNKKKPNHPLLLPYSGSKKAVKKSVTRSRSKKAKT